MRSVSVGARRAGSALVLISVMLWAINYLILASAVLTVVPVILAFAGVVLIVVGVVRRTRR